MCTKEYINNKLEKLKWFPLVDNDQEMIYIKYIFYRQEWQHVVITFVPYVDFYLNSFGEQTKVHLPLSGEELKLFMKLATLRQTEVSWIKSV